LIKPKLLKLVAYENPVLRQKCLPVSFPLDQKLINLINDMVYSIQPEQLKAAGAPWEAAVGMAANQWGLNYSIFLYCPYGDSINGLEVIINPSYSPTADSTHSEWEGCFSVPLATGNIRRYDNILAKYQTIDGKLVERELNGWEARVWQHETDHLNGLLYDDPHASKCLEKKTFTTVEEVEAFYDKIREERTT
jgi:peptide deformylase